MILDWRGSLPRTHRVLAVHLFGPLCSCYWSNITERSLSGAMGFGRAAFSGVLCDKASLAWSEVFLRVYSSSL